MLCAVGTRKLNYLGMAVGGELEELPSLQVEFSATIGAVENRPRIGQKRPHETAPERPHAG